MPKRGQRKQRETPRGRQVVGLVEASREGFERFIVLRDGGLCRRCARSRGVQVAYGEDIEQHPELARDALNAVLLCQWCIAWLQAQEDRQRIILEMTADRGYLQVAMGLLKARRENGSDKKDEGS